MSSVLNLIIAQRLVRKICPTCIYSFEADDGARATVIHQLKELGIEGAESQAPHTIYKGKGCSACGMTGYRGRMGIFELLQVKENIKAIISAEHFNLDALRQESRKAGTTSMFEDGLAKVQVGKTTLEEVLRVIRE